jgi:hypothetical protein
MDFSMNLSSSSNYFHIKNPFFILFIQFLNCTGLGLDYWKVQGRNHTYSLDSVVPRWTAGSL